jgi:hypothetical protein
MFGSYSSKKGLNLASNLAIDVAMRLPIFCFPGSPATTHVAGAWPSWLGAALEPAGLRSSPPCPYWALGLTGK